MALLQISEPGQSLDPHQRKLVVGIDLGTTHSLVATFRNGAAETLADEYGQHILPSVVRYTAQGAEVGAQAQAQLVNDAINTIASVKRLMGRGLEDLPKQHSYRINEQHDSGMPYLQTEFASVNPVEVSAEILKSLSARAQERLGDELFGAVITVPAYFDDAQRQATKDAARIAGLNVLRLLNEPTAAAIAYGLDEGNDELIAVYDLGGGTFDISILHLHEGVFQVKATGGDTALGGDDFDLAIVEWLQNQIGLTDQVLSLEQKRRLKQAAKNAKEKLTDKSLVRVDLQDTFGWQGELNREVFNQCIAGLIEDSLQACRQAVSDANVSLEKIDKVVMVGGSTRVPLVQEKVSALFGKTVYCELDPDRVVALGAAIQADILAGNRKDTDLLLLDVVPLSLGLETMGGLMEPLIRRNTPIPVTKAQEFTTYKDGQTAMALHVLQGERDRVEDCRSLGRFELRGIPAMVAGAARIQVNFQIDADGLLEVSAQEETTGVRSHIQVKPSYGLSDEEVMQMLQSSHKHAQEDKLARQLRELQVEADQLLVTVTNAFDEDSDLLDEQEAERLKNAVDVLQQARIENQVVSMKDAIAGLSVESETLAARRMNKTINQALAGTHLDQLESDA